MEQLAAGGDVRRRCGGADARESDLETRVFRIAFVGFLVEIKCGVVVFAGLGGLTLLEVRVGRLGVKASDEDAKSGRDGQDREGEGPSLGHGSGDVGWGGGLCGVAMEHTAPRHEKKVTKKRVTKKGVTEKRSR